MENITISKAEYDELLLYKNEAIEASLLGKKKGSAYDKYKYIKGLYDFMKKQYEPLIVGIEEEYRTLYRGKNV